MTTICSCKLCLDLVLLNYRPLSGKGRYKLCAISFLLVRYKVGQRFGRHIDESVDLGAGKHTHYTLLIYLNGGFKTKSRNVKGVPQDSPETLVGGETVFYGPRNGLVAEVNPLFLFDCFLYILFFFFFFIIIIVKLHF